jgi:hypothetical protein
MVMMMIVDFWGCWLFAFWLGSSRGHTPAHHMSLCGHINAPGEQVQVSNSAIFLQPLPQN